MININELRQLVQVAHPCALRPPRRKRRRKVKIEKIPEGYLLARKGGNGCELWRKFNGAESMACDAIDELIAERDELRAKIEAMEKQEPARLVTATAYRWRYRGAVMWQYGELTEETARLANEHNHEVQPLYALPDAQNVPDFADAYQGAMEEVAIWKKRALQAEDLNRKFIAEINGATHMGDPAQPAQPAQPTPTIAEQDHINAEAAIRSIYGARPNDEALWQTIGNGMITPAHIAQAVADGTITPAYIMQPAPSVPDGYKLVPIVSTDEMDSAGADHCDGYLSTAQAVWDAMLAAAPEAKS